MIPKDDPSRPSLLHGLASAFLRIFFHLLYHSLAWTYDLVAATVSVGRWQGWVRSAAKLVTGSQVLELGYGPGHLQVHLCAAGKTVFGLDESRQMARQAARRLRKGGFLVQLVRGMAQNLPYADESFDDVLATFPTPYIIDPLTLQEILRVLRPNGRLVVLISAWITGSGLADRLMAFINRIAGQAPPPGREPGEFTRPFGEAGFDVNLRFEDYPTSRLMMILAVKPGDHRETQV